MKMKSMVLLAVAAVCGLVAMLGVQQILSGSGEPEVPKERVLVATADITPSAPLDETNTEFREMPVTTVPEGAVTSREQHDQRGLKRGAFPGDVITTAKLGEKGQLRASMEIPDGMRVVTVSVNLTKTHSGLILPHDRVDVQLTYKTRDDSLGMLTKTKTLLEYVKVFATDALRDANNSEGGEVHAKNISLLVTPEQANLLMLAESKGNLTLALRSKDDTKTVQTKGISEADLDNMKLGRGSDDVDPNAGEGAVADSDAPKNAEALAAPPQTGDVRSFLKQAQSTPAPAEDENAPPAVPNKRVWNIEIYQGGEKRIEQIELPEEVAQVTSADSAVPWMGYLKMMLPSQRTSAAAAPTAANR